MIRFYGPDPISCLKGDSAHAARLLPLAYELLAVIAAKLGKGRDIHTLHSVKGGVGSFCLTLNDGREFHFRGRDGEEHIDHLEVYTTYAYRAAGLDPVAVLTTPEECRDFIKEIANPWIARANRLRSAA